MSLRRIVIACLACWSILALAPLAQAQPAENPDAAAITSLHLAEAKAYQIQLGNPRGDMLQLEPTPVFAWQNLLRDGGQLGQVFVWTSKGRPEVIGTMFSEAEGTGRKVVHEFHTLSESPLLVAPPPGLPYQWRPQATLPFVPLLDAPEVAPQPVQRLRQMKSIARELTATSYKPEEKERVELRLSPQPLIRYQPTGTNVIDGALFAFLSNSAGTDPEVLVLIEARREAGEALTWMIGVARFSDRDLEVKRKETTYFSSLSDPHRKAEVVDGWKMVHNSDDTYFVFQARHVEPPYGKK